MAKSENELRSKFKKLIKKFRPYSIENLLTTPGLPDCAITTGWIEFKCEKEWPVRASTPLRIKWQPGQKSWASAWAAAGGGYWLVVKVDGEIFIFDAEAAQYVGDITRSEMKHQAMAHFETWPTPEQVTPYFEARKRG